MEGSLLKINKLAVTANELRTLTAEERNMLFLSEHILNELNSLNKMFGWCLHQDIEEDRSELNSRAKGMQALFFARLKAGKLYEAWQALQASWFRERFHRALQITMHEESIEALEQLRRYFGPKNALSGVRNSFAFHYSARTLGENWEEAVESDGYQAFLGGTIGNNVYLGAEMVANAAVLRSMGKSGFDKNLKAFFDEVHIASSRMTLFLEGVSIAIREKATGKSIHSGAEVVHVKVKRAFSEVSIPYFCRIDDPDHDASPVP